MNSPKRPLSPEQARNRIAALCARSEQAPKDVLDKLTGWGIGTEEASRIVSDLTEQGFVDERRYARAFVKDRFAFNGWGKIKIEHHLRLKGIPAQAIAQAMTVIDDRLYRERLTELLRAKWRTVSQREPRAAWAAMMRFAASRGFEAAIAAQCVQQVTRIDADQD